MCNRGPDGATGLKPGVRPAGLSVANGISAPDGVADQSWLAEPDTGSGTGWRSNGERSTAHVHASQHGVSPVQTLPEQVPSGDSQGQPSVPQHAFATVACSAQHDTDAGSCKSPQHWAGARSAATESNRAKTMAIHARIRTSYLTLLRHSIRRAAREIDARS